MLSPRCYVGQSPFFLSAVWYLSAKELNILSENQTKSECSFRAAYILFSMFLSILQLFGERVRLVGS